MKQHPKVLITRHEAAKLLSIDPVTIWRWTRGRHPRLRPAQHHPLKFDSRDVMRQMTAAQLEAAKEKAR